MVDAEDLVIGLECRHGSLVRLRCVRHAAPGSPPPADREATGTRISTSLRETMTLWSKNKEKKT
jgi:hypothetical protein